LKILITGPESTGKTTLATQLSEQLSINLLPDYSRIYLEKYGPDYAYDDILLMAKEHHALLHSVSPKEDIILDSYMLNYQIWSEYKYNTCDSWILDQVKMMDMDYIFLLYPDIMWEPDPLRESKEEREILFDIYNQKLIQLKIGFHIIKGEKAQRIKAVNEMLFNGI